MSIYEKLFEHSADAMCELDTDGNILRTNHAAERLLGTASQASGATHFDLLEATSHAKLKRILAQLNQASPTDSFDGQLHGTDSWVSWQLTWTGEGHIVAVGRDASELYATSIALTQKSAFLESIIEAEPECVKLVNGDGLLLDMNKAGLRMIAAKNRSDAIGQCTYDMVVPEDRERFAAFNEQVCGGTGGELVSTSSTSRARAIRWKQPPCRCPRLRTANCSTSRSPATSPSATFSNSNSCKRRRWRPSGNSLAESHMTSTTC